MSASIPVLLDRQYILPPGAAGSLGYGHSLNPWAFGDSVVLADELDTDSVLMGICAVSFANPLSFTAGMQIAVCTGPDDNLVVVSQYRTRVAQFVNTAGVSGINFLPNIVGVDRLPAGERLSFRLCMSTPCADGWYVRAAILKKPLAGRLAMTTDAQYCLPDAADDFVITTPAVQDEFSAWQTVRAAAGPQMYITDFILGQPTAGQWIEYEFAIGAEGDEEDNIIHRDVHHGGRMTDLIGGAHPQYVPVYVPAATRLAWRARNRNSAIARSVSMALTYVTSYLDWFEQT